MKIHFFHKWLFNTVILLVFIASSSKTGLSKRKNFVVIEKPYERVFYDTTPVPAGEPVFDQLSKSCPLPYMSSSRRNGCRCNYKLN